MKDIYSPLEIDEEWDNFAPAGTAVAEPEAPSAPTTNVTVTGGDVINPSADSTSVMPTSTEAPSEVSDPAREAAMDAISQPSVATEPQTPSPDVNANIASWTSNDGTAPAAAGDSNTLEINDMGSSAAPTQAPEVTKISVEGDSSEGEQENEADALPTPEVPVTTDAPTPVKVEVPEGAEKGEDEGDDAADKEEVQKTPDPAVKWEEPKAEEETTSQEPTEPETPNDETNSEGPAPEVDTSEKDEARAAYIRSLEKSISKEQANKERMEADLARLQDEAEELKKGIANSEGLIKKDEAELEKFKS